MIETDRVAGVMPIALELAVSVQNPSVNPSDDSSVNASFRVKQQNAFKQKGFWPQVKTIRKAAVETACLTHRAQDFYAIFQGVSERQDVVKTHARRIAMQHQPIHPQIRREAQTLFEDSPLDICDVQGNEHSWGWALDDFMDLLVEFHDQPVQELRPMIRRVVTERAFLDSTGDSIYRTTGNDVRGSQFEIQIDQIVAVLEKVRQHAVSRGQWSDQALPPLMCG